MTDSPKKRALVVRDFDDEGTGERFTKNSTPLINAGAFANYEAAGLITAAPTAKPKQPSKLKAAAKPKSKPKAPAAPASAAPAEQPETSPADDISAAAD